MDSNDLASAVAPIDTSQTPLAIGHVPIRRRPTNALSRVSAAVTRQRCEAVAIAIIEGRDRVNDLFAWSQETDERTGRPWNIKLRTMIKYRQRAYALLEAESRETRDAARARQLGIRRRLYATAVQDRNVPAALAVAKDESELLGLYPDKATASGTTIGNINVIAASVQQAIADPRYIAWLESQPPEPQQREPLALTANVATGAMPVDQGLSTESTSDDLPSCDEQDSAAVDHI